MKIRILFFLLFLILSRTLLGLTGFSFSSKLQSNSIYSITQDSLGFLWISYGTGIAKFDGYTVYPLSLPDNRQTLGFINSVEAKNSNNIFISSNKGLFLYNYVTHSLKTTSNELDNKNVISVKEDSRGNYWVATYQGLFHFDHQFRFIEKFDKNNGLSNGRINSIYIDGENIWIGTETGLDLISLKDNNISARPISKGYRTAKILMDNNDLLWHCRNEEVYVANRNDVLHEGDVFKNIALNAEVISMIEYKNEIWIGTRGAGILKYKITKNSIPQFIEQLWISPANKNEINNTILSLFEDNYSNVWIGTHDGLFLFDNEAKSPFRIIKNDPENSNTPSHNTISSIYCDEKNNLWLATANGINKFTWNGNNTDYTIQKFYDNSSETHKIRNNKIQTIIERQNNQFLISTKSTIKFFDANKKIFYENKSVNDTLNKYQMKYVRSSFKDQNGNIWLAFSEGGIGVLDYATGNLLRLNLVDEGDVHRTIVRDNKGQLWFSSDNRGLYKVSVEKNLTEITEEKIYPKDQFDKDWITTLFVDKSENIWVGTLRGVFKYDSENDTFNKQSLPHFNTEVYVNGIIEDLYDNIWVSSLRGVFRFSDKIESHYYEPNPMDDYSKALYITGLEIDKTGTIFTGGIDGLIFFNPTNIYSGHHPQKTLISSFYIMNEPYYPNGKQLYKDINVTSDPIRLNHTNKQFSFEFSALYYPNPMKIKYAYMLEGFDNDWIYTDSHRRFASYSNIPYGNYTFKVKSTGISGVWNQTVTEIPLKILPPPWKTWWAYLLYFVLSVLFFYLIYRLTILSTKVKVEKKENQSKIRSYINLSYSMKAPLALLYAPVQYYIKNYDNINPEEAKSLLKIINRNTRKLSDIIVQMVEYRKSDFSKHTLNLSTVDLVKFIEDIYKSFKWLSISKEIDFQLHSNIEKLEVVIDPKKIEIVLFNLLDNAFKNTPKGGKITLNCELDTRQYKLFVNIIDNGAGIPKEKLKNIFGRFQSSDNPAESLLPESGIGLSLVKDFLELHHSTIKVKSEPAIETVFSFYIHLGSSHFADYPNIAHDVQSYAKSPVFDIEPQPPTTSVTESIGTKLFFYTKDYELLNFINKIIEKHFICYHSEIPHTIIEEIKNSQPSIIVIDVSENMNPDLLDICKQIKESSSTSPIPLLLIYSSLEGEDISEIFEIEADGYLNNPSEITVIKTRIDQLMKSRRKIREQVRKELIVKSTDMETITEDEVFINKVLKIVDENMQNVEFTVDDLANHMNLSRSTFYRKINQITNMAPSEFIKVRRLERAKLLLAQTSYNVTEVSEKVGFADAGYFSQSFRKHFGITPKAYSMKKDP